MWVCAVTANNKVYDGTTTATLNTGSATLMGVIGSDSVTLSTSGATGTFASPDVANGITVTVAGMSISGAQAGDYTLTQPTPTANITPASLWVCDVTANNKVYDGTTTATLNTGSATLMGVIGSDSVTLSTSGATGTFASQDVANGIAVTVAGMSISGAQAGDYTLTQPTPTANITQASLWVCAVTANNKVYDGTTAATLNTGSATLMGVIGSDSVTLSTSGATGTFASADVANGIAVHVSGMSISGAQAGDYTLTQPTPTADIAPATLTVSVTDAGGTYSTVRNPATDASVTGVGTDGPIASFGYTTLSYSYYNSAATLLAGAPTAAGAYTVVAHYTSNNPNYTNADSSPVSFTITPDTLTAAIVGDPTKTYDGTRQRR